MENRAFFNRLVQQDMNEICHYYREEAGETLADRFFDVALLVIEKATANPRHFHPLENQPLLRRAVWSREFRWTSIKPEAPLRLLRKSGGESLGRRLVYLEPQGRS